MRVHSLIRSLSLFVFPFLAVLLAAPVAAQESALVAPLSGSAEVPEVDTGAVGYTVMHLNEARDELSFKLAVANIERVTQAHIHCGAADVNGPVVVTLLGLLETAANLDSIAVEGTVTNDDVMPLPESEVCPGGIADFDELLAKIEAGEAYVNVHTEQNPAGEVRGQIR